MAILIFCEYMSFVKRTDGLLSRLSDRLSDWAVRTDLALDEWAYMLSESADEAQSADEANLLEHVYIRKFEILKF